MKHLLKFCLIAIASIAIAGCNGNKITVTSFSPQGEINTLQTFTIRFSEDIVNQDMVDEWVDGEFISFSPEIEGKYKWVGTSTLLFSPDKALMPATAYTAKLDEGKLLEGTGKKGSFDKFSFNTAFLRLDNVQFFWDQIPKSNFQVNAKANLNFNYDVDPATIREYLDISQDGKPLTDYTIETQAPASTISLDFGKIKQTEKHQKLALNLKKGLVSVFGGSPVAEGSSHSLQLPPLTKMKVISANAGFDGNQGWIKIHFSQPVDQKEAKSYISITPTVKNMVMTTADNYLHIEGNLKAGGSVKVKVKKGIAGLYGGSLQKEFEENVPLADLDPVLAFTDKKGQYLLRGGLENIEVKSVNTPKAKLNVYEVYKNNLVHFFFNNQQNYYYDYYYDEYDDYGSRKNYQVGNYGKKLFELEMDFGQGKNQQFNQTVNLNEVLNQRFKGIYVVEVRSSEDYWKYDSKLVAISDIGLIAKRSQGELVVFANSIKTATPLAGVKLSLVSLTNQVLASGQTDDQGILRVSNLKEDTEGFDPRMLLAELGDDFNFLNLNDTRIETSRFDVGGKYVPEDGYDCFVYGDRNLYRPGETAFLSGIIRSPDMEVVTDIPVRVKVLNPQGRKFREFQQTLNGEGSFELSIDLPDHAKTGPYKAEIYNGADKLLTSYAFHVEDFVPDKIRVNLKSDQKEIKPGDKFKVDINAEYLFGAAAANNKYEVDISLSHRPFYSRNFSAFRFNNHSYSNSSLSNHFENGNLDAEGNGILNYTLGSNISSGGFVEGKAFVSVFDASGRTVNQVTSFKAFPKEYFIGIKGDRYYYGTGKNINLDLVAVDPADQGINNFDAELQLVRYDWITVLRKNNSSGRYRYRSEKKEVKVWNKTLKLNNGGTPYNFRVEKSGNYELRISKRGEKGYVKKQFYAYRWGNNSNTTFEIDKDGQVDIILDKKEYKPGDNAKILFVAPFAGKLLVTFERGKVIEHRYLEMTDSSYELEMPISDEMLPNVYVTATLFRPHSHENTSPFLVGHGVASMKVLNPDNKLAVEIKAPDKIKPRTSQEITIKTRPNQNIYVTLAAVDEGILQVKNFSSPNPYAHMYAKRQLGVTSYDMYKFLLPEVPDINSSPAGGDESSAKRLNPVKAERFKLVANWSGIRKTNSRGEVKVNLNIPQYNGEIRLMAVAYSGAAFGSASKPMTVADDLILMPSIPRVLSMNDSLVMPVTVLNTTDKSGKASVSVEVEGPLAIRGKKEQSLSLDPKGSEMSSFTILADNGIGKGKIRIKTKGMDEVLEEIEIAVRPVSPLVQETFSGIITAGETKSITQNSSYVPGTETHQVSISPFPGIRLSNHLKYLLKYPHGCAEQTTSKLFPQLYFNELAALAAPDVYRKGNPVHFIREGINKLQGMQRHDGSFNYWPSGGYANKWVSVYVTHFLLEAKAAGYDVDQDVINLALDFMGKLVVDKERDNYSYYQNGKWQKKSIAKHQVIYGLYVLALGGRADAPMMNFYRARPNLLSGDMKYLLAGAFAHAKNYNAFHEVLPKAFSAEVSKRTSGNSFYSEARANAIMLNVLLDVDPGNKEIPKMVDYLSKMGKKIWSTQDRAWSFLAMGKAAKAQGESDITLQVLVNGKSVGTFEPKGGTDIFKELEGNKIELKATGNGATYYYVETEGIKLNEKVENVDKNMRIRRTYLNRTGNPVSEFNQGDLIVCRIDIDGGNYSTDNIAITDMVPAAFEIDNPRLNPSADLSWINSRGSRFTPQYMDIRDDRIILYTNVRGGQSRSFYYLLRVVGNGTYKLPAIAAEAMYDPDVYSYNGEGLIRVKP